MREVSDGNGDWVGQKRLQKGGERGFNKVGSLAREEWLVRENNRRLGGRWGWQG